MNHRAIQRTLFRMLLDEGFRARALAGKELDHLSERERAIVTGASPTALSADRDGKRRGQVIGNLVGEFVLTHAVAPRAVVRRGFPQGFFTTPGFHQAVMADRRLPLAFADYVEAQARESDDVAFASFAALECAMARARREAWGGEPEGALAPQVALVELPDGTVAAAEAFRAALDRGQPPQSPDSLGAGSARETVMTVGRPAENPRALPEVAVEVLEDAVAAVVQAAAAGPLVRARRDELARSFEVETAELDEFLESLVEDGVLIRERIRG